MASWAGKRPEAAADSDAIYNLFFKLGYKACRKHDCHQTLYETVFTYTET